MSAATTTEESVPTSPQGGHDWREAGAAWGHAAVDWSCLYEHYATEVIAAIHDEVGVRAEVSVLDLACGSGLAVQHGRGRGARMSGIDASGPLIEIARERNPGCSLVHGSMFELPWPDEHFGAVTSVNGIWGGCLPALVEAHRVLEPGGRVGFSFWGVGPPLDLRPLFKVFARHVPERNLTGMRTLNNIAFPGVAERMLNDAGFDFVTRGSRVSTIEFPDSELAWRALTSTGPAYPALQRCDRATLRREVLEAIEPCRDERGVYRFRNDHQFVIGQKPC